MGWGISFYLPEGSEEDLEFVGDFGGVGDSRGGLGY
jgi:hypothetical protein